MSPESSTPASRRRRNPRGEGHQLRSDLITATCELLEGGATDADLSMRAVARQAGVAATTVYLHFADREELLWAVSEAVFADLAGAMDDAAARATNPADDLRARALAYCQFGLDHPGYYHVLFGVVPVPKTSRSLAELPGGPVFERLEQAVRDSLPAGTDDTTARTATVVLWAALHGLVSLRATRPQFPWPAIDELVDATLAALGA